MDVISNPMWSLLREGCGESENDLDKVSTLESLAKLIVLSLILTNGTKILKEKDWVWKVHGYTRSKSMKNKGWKLQRKLWITSSDVKKKRTKTYFLKVIESLKTKRLQKKFKNSTHYTYEQHLLKDSDQLWTATTRSKEISMHGNMSNSNALKYSMNCAIP